MWLDQSSTGSIQGVSAIAMRWTRESAGKFNPLVLTDQASIEDPDAIGTKAAASGMRLGVRGIKKGT